MHSITTEQKNALSTFRDELTNEGVIGHGDTLGTSEDWVLLRFLRARKFNLKQAKSMLVNCLEWRKTVSGVGIDELYRKIDPYDYPERKEVFNCWPMWFHKTDKKGRPLNIQDFTGVDTEALFKVITQERLWETIVVNAESLTREVLPACSRSAGRLVDDVLVIVDLKGFGIGKFWQIKGLVQSCFQISQDYFPETMGQLAVVNAPYSFTAIWAVIRPWLAKETQEKVDILGANYQEVLLRLVDAENLPARLGGKCTCEAHGGCHLSSAGPWMENRKERREKWLRGELESAGLSPELEKPLDVELGNNDSATLSSNFTSQLDGQPDPPTKANVIPNPGLASNGHDLDA